MCHQKGGKMLNNKIKTILLTILCVLICILIIVVYFKELDFRLRESIKKEESLQIQEELLEEKKQLNKSIKELIKLLKDRPVSKNEKIINMVATAYTDDVKSQGKWVGKTASGMKPQVGVVAVDPKIIPLGTKLYVEGYNDNKICIAGDTGGAIKGKRIDLFMNSRNEALKFGRKKVKVRVVE